MSSASNKINRLENRVDILLIVNVILIIAIALIVVYLLWWPQVKLALFGAPFGSTLAGIDTPLTSAQLSIINGAPSSYFEIAGEKLLNGSLTDQVEVSNFTQYSPIIIDGKPTVIYMGAISCIYCGENRWAMALALSRFGNFTALYNGYSSFGDADVPTLYWKPDNYTTTAGMTYGNYYNSNMINFVSAEYDSPIIQGFQLPRSGLTYYVQNSPNQTYTKALEFMNKTGKFQGTPFTFWGSSLVQGADGVVFGNTTPTSASGISLTNETHQAVLNQLPSFNDQFAWSEYAAADVYVAEVCPSISNSAPVCSLPAIKTIGSIMGLTS